MTTKTTLREWIAEGEIERAIDALQENANEIGDSRFINDVTHQSGRYKKLQRDQLQGVLDDDDYRIQEARISQALLELIDKMPTGSAVSAPKVATPAVVNPTPEPVAPVADSDATVAIQPKTSPHLPWIIGLGLLLLILALVLFYPNPNSQQFFVFRIVLALAAAGLVSVVPGILKINLNNMLTGGGAVVAFLVVFFFNPPKVENDQPTVVPVAPFDLTVRLQVRDTLQVSSQYPALDSAAMLKIWLGNRWDTAYVDEYKLATFKGIPGELKDSSVFVELKTRYWQLQQDTVTLRAGTQFLTIQPDGSLEQFRGRILTTTGEFLSGVAVKVAGIQSNSDGEGYVEILIPREKQQIKQELIATKRRYKTLRTFVYPERGLMELRLRK